VVEWLEPLITDIERNFTTPSKADREESDSVFSWTHTQRLDYNFFTAMRTQLVTSVKAWQRSQKPVPENCKGGVEHLGTVNGAPSAAIASTTDKEAESSNAVSTPEKKTPTDGTKELSPPVGGVALPIDQLADPEAAKTLAVQRGSGGIDESCSV
jgi:hypothetical protein